MDSEVVEWVMAHFLPFEAELRVRLRVVCNGPAEVDDVVQETYCKVLTLASVDHIREPRGFLVRTAKNIVMDRLRREAVVKFEALDNLDERDFVESAPSTERVTAARAELKWVIGLIAKLPARCKEVFQARRVYGLSQNETADKLGISVGMVEQETMKGMELMSDMIERVGMPALPGRKPSARKSGKPNVNH